MRPTARLGTLALLAALAGSAGADAPASSPPTAPLRFGLFGDLPYNRWEREHLPEMIADMSRAAPDFLVHIGDLKAGSAPCSDAAFLDIRDVFNAAPVPLIYLPGDNDWTDCHRKSNGGYDPEGRLATLRRLFFATTESLGRQRIVLQRQAAFPENTRWEKGGVLFVTLNVTGSNNGFHGASGRGVNVASGANGVNGLTGSSGPSAEFLARNAANRAWLAAAFAEARARKLAGLLLAIQANPGFEAANAGHAQPGYRDFLQQLREETQAYAGQVVLVHGDTHHQQIDQPMRDPFGKAVVGNFTRVETFGSPFIGWIEATVDRTDPKVFRFTPRPWRPASPAR